MNFTIGSLFDGSGGFPLAAFMCGGVPVWASEIEPYPIAVTRSRFPYVKHLGSVTDINGAEIDPVDVVTFGSPCQDLSIAGKRAGLKHEDNGDDETTRSGLLIEAVRIIKEMRIATNGLYPRFVVWENVPGAFSSNKGEDFRIVLEELIKIVEPTAVMPDVPKNGWAYADCYSGDGWSLAYRVSDAQYWGVAQRRRRIYLVLDLGGQCAGEILFKRDGLRGYFEEGRSPWKGTAGDSEDSVGTADSAECVAYSFDSLASNSMKSSNPHSGCRQVEVSKTIDCFDPNPSKNQGGIAVLQPICMATQQGGAEIRTDDKAPTITAAAGMSGNNQPVVCYPNMDAKGASNTGSSVIAVDQGGGKSGANFYHNLSPTLTCTHGGEPVVAYSVENHPADSRVDIDESGKVQTLTSRMGTGGGNVPMVMVYRKGTRPHSADEAQKWENADVANTLNTFDTGEARANELVVMREAIPIHDQATRFSGKHGEKFDGKGNGLGVGAPGDPMNTLTSGDRHAVVYCVGNGQVDQLRMSEKVGALNCMHDQQAIVLDRAFFNQGQNALYEPQLYADGTCPTLVAKGPAAVCTRYIVRRLTPTECARLQGFPDDWGHPDKKTEFTDEEYRFWLNVRNTHAEINGKAVKDYTKKQMLTWYNKLHVDSSEYKMWGNGIALPNALYVMQGIADALK